MVKSKYIVLEAYENSNLQPIELNAGDKVSVGEKSEDHSSWDNWVYCVSMTTGKSGWTPIQILQVEGEFAVVTEDYTARELTVKVGERLQGSKELNGWIWCERQESSDFGWVPKACLRSGS